MTNFIEFEKQLLAHDLQSAHFTGILKRRLVLFGRGIWRVGGLKLVVPGLAIVHIAENVEIMIEEIYLISCSQSKAMRGLTKLGHIGQSFDLG